MLSIGKTILHFGGFVQRQTVACDCMKTQGADAIPLKLSYLPGPSFTLSS